MSFEDYAKVVPVAETKVSLVVASKDFHDPLRRLNELYMLSPSPFVLRLGIEFLKDLRDGGLQRSLAIVRENGECAHELLSQTFLKIVAADTPSSVIWLQCIDSTISGEQFAEYCKSNGLYVVGGTHYFWADHRAGRQFIRVACMRDPTPFKMGISRLGELARDFQRNTTA